MGEQVIKTRNIAVANRKSHNYAVQLLVKATNIPYSVELAKLMNLIINGNNEKCIMYLINNLTINKMKKYNIWNKIFHKRELNKNIADYKLQQGLVNSYECWLTKIGNANTLSECMILHKRIWRKGFRNANLGPDKYGMFRAKDINFMTTNEVYIGGFNGLNILTIEEWEDSKEELYDSTQTCYDIVLCAYKKLLKSNIIALADNAKLLVAEYQQNNYKL